MTQPASTPDLTIADLLLARSGDDSIGLRFEGDTWTWDEQVQASADRARWLESKRVEGPFHVGVLLDNVPEFPFLIGAAALSGAVVVGLNSTRAGAALARDIAGTDCQMIVTEAKYLDVLEAAEPAIPRDRTFVVDDPSWDDELQPFVGSSRTAPAGRSEADLVTLIFTSGTSGDPKAVRMTNRKLCSVIAMLRGFPAMAPADAEALVATLSKLPMVLRREDVIYLSMPMFHSACLVQGWVPAVSSGASMVLRRRFSASGFMVDVREYGVTYVHYVGKPLSYVLATPEQADDADNTLRLAIGNEAAPQDVGRFAARFGCEVIDTFGSSEAGVSMGRSPDTPPGALGKLPAGGDILHPVTDLPVPPAKFDEQGRVLNFDEAVGELVNTAGAGLFEGYYRNPEADAERMRDGMYRSGDLAYRDEDGFVYFAGRSMEWIRVDGENFGAAPVEQILTRYPWAALVAVYAVADRDVGDQVMAALQPQDLSGPFDGAAFAQFLADQPDLGTKWAPRYVRVMDALPATATNKVLKRVLAQEAWEAPDVFIRDGDRYRPMTSEDRVALRAAFEERGNARRLPAPQA